MTSRSSMRLLILTIVVAISGFSQGMLMPVIAIIFEQDGISSSVNGFHAASLYIGMLLIAPFMEKPLRKFGYKPMIISGGLAVIISLTLFPLWESFWFWFILRFIIGIGDNMLHFGSQTWIIDFSPQNKRGRNIALYGFSFGLGFTIGPVLTRLLEINESLPFMVSAGLALLAWSTLFLLKNDFPQASTQTTSFLDSFKRFNKVWKYAWVAFLPPLGYGFMEASLNGNFPVFALRNGIDVEAVSIILPAFALGSIIFQLPLGVFSDHFGRKRILSAVMMLGGLIFFTAGVIQNSVIGLFICFLLSGMLVGSTYSLGVAYMADLAPKKLFPAGNLMCSILYSIGSISGPFIGGLVIQFIQGGSFFYMISLMLFAIFTALMLFKPKSQGEAANQSAS